MPELFLYSTNTFLKYHICQKYRKDIHYVWCSPSFDCSTLSSYAPESLSPASSNPSNIYRSLKADVSRSDLHSDKIKAQRASLTKLAVQWEEMGEINRQEKVDIIYMIKNVSFEYWRPLIYVIHRSSVEKRIELVPMKNRAGLADEFIIRDLHRSEFDVIEV